ncbi:hypothetical protein E2C01_037264 [Portunus trituberculatus]|uniref:Uncharacterized protein n=1 Tax=Portunus trituberculatus TaxID=210409 RepID=A0A5B7FGM0_PORTR|nr:hypothetical protein [Portunus trituberculatus]
MAECSNAPRPSPVRWVGSSLVALLRDPGHETLESRRTLLGTVTAGSVQVAISELFNNTHIICDAHENNSRLSHIMEQVRGVGISQTSRFTRRYFGQNLFCYFCKIAGTCCIPRQHRGAPGNYTVQERHPDLWEN